MRLGLGEWVTFVCVVYFCSIFCVCLYWSFFEMVATCAVSLRRTCWSRAWEILTSIAAVRGTEPRIIVLRVRVSRRSFVRVGVSLAANTMSRAPPPPPTSSLARPPLSRSWETSTKSALNLTRSTSPHPQPTHDRMTQK